MIKIIFALIINFSMMSFSFAAPGILSRFNHEAHEKGAFKTMQFDCSGCHNFSFGSDKVKAKAEAGLTSSTFKADLKNTCHQCHNTENTKFSQAPKECILCHAKMEGAKEIKPLSHQNAEWKTTHSLNARTEGTSCLNCHIQSDCLKCHLRRNDIQMQNHSRNFRFTHSVEARAQPHRCDACHTQNFCVKCHIGK
jgi:hypothetical protein